MSTTYTAYFHTVVDVATVDFAAETPEEALRVAKAYLQQNGDKLEFELREGRAPVDEIEIATDSDPEIAVWRSADRRLRLAASDLLSAAQTALDYLTDHAIDLDGEPEELLAGIRADLADAIAAAKPEEE